MIRPNRSTLGLAGLLMAMLYAGLTQNNAPAFLLAFLLVSLSTVSALHAWRNMRGLEIKAEPIASVFEGESLVVPISLQSTSGRRHFGITARLARGGDAAWIAEVPARGTERVELLGFTEARGRFPSLEVIIGSVFPLGFFTVWRKVTLPQPYYVFPRAEGELPLPSDDPSSLEMPVHLHRSGDDFAGTRDWQMGESMRHVDWKAVARGQRLMVKQWRGGVTPHFVLDAEMLAALPLEPRWRQLTRWVVQAERRGAGYELRLPGETVPPGHGERHLETCLRLLAQAPRERLSGRKGGAI